MYHTSNVQKECRTYTVAFKPSNPGITKFEERLTEVANIKPEGEYEIDKNSCKEFIRTEHCTHYIQAIMYGAKEYKVTYDLRHKSYDEVKTLGRFDDNNVAEEVPIEVEIVPIYEIIVDQKIKLLLKAALEEYFKELQQSTGMSKCIQ